MKPFWRIAQFAKPYMKYIWLNITFNLIAIFFALSSIGLVIPVLRIIFERDNPIPPAPILAGSDWAQYLQEYLTYQISVRMQSTDASQALFFVCAWVIGAFFMKSLSRYLANFFMAPLRNGVTRDLRNKMHQKILALPLSFFSAHHKGDIISRMTGDLKEIEVSVLTTLELLFKDPAMIFASLAVLFYMSPQLTLFVLILLPVVALAIARIGYSLKRSSRKAQDKLGELLSQTEEDLSGLKVIKAFNAESLKQNAFQKHLERYYVVMNRVMRKSDLSSPTTEFLSASVLAIIIWFGGSLVLKGQDFGGEEFIAYILFFYQIIPPAKALSKASNRIQRGNAASERVLEILDAENHICDAPQAQAIFSFERAIDFEQVGFAYGQKEVLHRINLKVPKGKTVALVGQSGGGKTTLTHLLPRFYDVSSGRIAIDGKDIRELKMKDLRQLMGVVTQETVLFNDTVFNNIALSKPTATEAEVEEAARIANAHEFIENLPQGYHTSVGNSGDRLSGGQRQRLSIARAVLKNPPILILDEATSALDTESEKMVQDALLKLMKNRTSLVIAHRLSTIQHADVIVVLEQGAVIESGSHEELMQREGTYRKLVEMQSFG